MLISEIYTLITSFITTVLSDDTIKVYRANQNFPRTKKPFVTTSINSLRQVATPSKGSTNNEGIKTIILNKKFTLSLQAYADELHRSEDILNTIHNALYTQEAYDVFKAQIAYVKTLLGITSAPVAIDGNFESRALLELEFDTNQKVESNVGLIETIYYHDELTNQNFIINKE